MNAGDPRGTGKRDPPDEMSGGFFILKCHEGDIDFFAPDGNFLN
jgi:hypothetical protein